MFEFVTINPLLARVRERGITGAEIERWDATSSEASDVRNPLRSQTTKRREHLPAAFEFVTINTLLASVRERGITGAEIERWDATSGEAGDVGPAEL